ncbi:MAG: NIPSNAP family protein [Candidatus Bathyarchaeota archaeon]|nr:MAG: NIPSNAP family protein [Candidatus Bathyarchaeota archaeon]
MIYEWRIYEVMPGKMSMLNNVFEKLLVKLFKKHGIRVIGFWQTVIGTGSRLYYLVSFENLAGRDKAWNSFYSDPEFIKGWANAAREGPLVAKVINTILQPTQYSPMK